MVWCADEWFLVLVWFCERDGCSVRKGRELEREKGVGAVEGMSISLCWRRSNVTENLGGACVKVWVWFWDFVVVVFLWWR